MRAGLGLGVLWLATIVLAPAALATSTGSFRIDGPLALSWGASTSSESPLALYLGETREADLVLHASHVVVHQFERQAIAPAGLVSQSLDAQERTWGLNNVTITRKTGGEQDGILGIYPLTGASSSLVTATSTTFEVRASGYVPADRSASDDLRRTPDYVERVDRPHIYLKSPGTLAYAGPGAVKIRGFDVTIQAQENTTHWETGFSQESPIRQVARWLYIEFDEAVITIQSQAAPIEIASELVNLEWNGAASFKPTSGHLTAPDGEYAPSASIVKLDGHFTSALVPVRNNPTSMDLTGLTGDLRSASGFAHQSSTKVALPANASRSPWPLVGVALGLVMAVSAAAVGVRRKLKTQRVSKTVVVTTSAPLIGELESDGETVESRFEEAQEAAEAGDWPAAVDLLSRAAALSAERSARIVIELGIAYSMVGEYETARQTVDGAANIIQDGEAELWAARFCLKMEKFDQAAAYLVQALDLPELMRDVLAQIDSEEEFAGLREYENVHAALKTARARDRLSRD